MHTMLLIQFNYTKNSSITWPYKGNSLVWTHLATKFLFQLFQKPNGNPCTSSLHVSYALLMIHKHIESKFLFYTWTPRHDQNMHTLYIMFPNQILNNASTNHGWHISNMLATTLAMQVGVVNIFFSNYGVQQLHYMFLSQFLY